MSEILDEPIKEYQLNRFTDAAYARCKTGIIFFVIIILFTIIINITSFTPGDISFFSVGILMLLSMIYGVLGFVSSVKSIYHKEENNYFTIPKLSCWNKKSGLIL